MALENDDLNEIERYLSEKLPFMPWILIYDDSSLEDSEQEWSRYGYLKSKYSNVFMSLGLLEAAKENMLSDIRGGDEL